MDCLWFGSVPVIIADYYDLPLADLIDWSSISVAVRESEVSQLQVSHPAFTEHSYVRFPT